jgi:ppGpp synthetase/RelA/SpoT-type nucleotidyltranferase
MDDLQAARQRWEDEEPQYGAFVDAVKERLNALLKRYGVCGEVTGRPKTLDSLLKKLILKPGHTYDTLSDKAGARVTVRFTTDIKQVRAAIETHFTIIKIDDKTAELRPDQFKYQGVHFDAKLPDNPVFASLQIEIQVCTKAQHLWSDLSHDLAYKTVMDLPPAIHRQVHSLSALLEIVDREFQHINEAIYALPNGHALHVLTALERSFIRINPTPYSKDLSIEVINALDLLYPGDADLTGNHYEAFAAQHGVKLEHVLLQNQGRSPFLTQPEVLMIFDLLQIDEFVLKDCWSKCFPPDELERLAILWGKPLL